MEKITRNQVSLEFSVEKGPGNASSQGGNIWGKVGDYGIAAAFYFSQTLSVWEYLGNIL